MHPAIVPNVSPQRQAVIASESRARGIMTTLADFLQILWRRRAVVLTTILASLLVALVYLFTATPKYSATVSLLIQNKEDTFQQLAMIQEAITGAATPGEDVVTELEVMRSRRLAAKVVDDMDLVNDPEFNESLVEPSTVAKIVGWVNPMRLLALVMPAPAPEDTSEERRKAVEREKVIDSFMDHLSVSQLGVSRLFFISFLSENSDKAATIANTLADAYIIDRLEARYEETRRATDWLSQKIADMRTDLSQKERVVEEFRKEAGLLAGIGGNTLITQQVSELSAQLIVARTARAEAEARLAQIRRMGQRPGGAAAAADVLGSPVIIALLTQEAEIKRTAAQLADEYGERHPRIISVRSELRDIQSKIATEVAKVVQKLENDVGVAQAREASLQQGLEQLKRTMGQTNTADVQLRALEREVETNRTMLQSFMNRFEEMSAQLDLNQQSTVRVLSRAIGPERPSWPRKSLILVVVFLGSALLGIGLVFLLEQFDRGFRSGEQIEEQTGVRSLGMVPALEGSRRRVGDPVDYVLKRPASAFGEAIRSVYTSILMAAGTDKTGNSVLITSCQPGEGKTTLSMCVARMFAASGRKVVMIEADVRRPRASDALRVPSQPGLVELLTDRADLADVLHKDDKSGAYIIPAGGPAADPTHILASPGVRSVVDALSKNFDLIIVDSPPLMAVADSRILAPQVDSTVLVVRWGSTHRNVVALGLKKLFETGARVSGVVLAQVDSKKHAEYGYGDSAYYYKPVKKYYQS
jgi:succinoglycan biosynthesis transport protein ExoP